MTERLGDFYDQKDLREYEDPRPEWLKGKYGRLSDRDILRCLEEGIIKIVPLPEDIKKALNPIKIDCHLGETLRCFKGSRLKAINLVEEIPQNFLETVTISAEDPFSLHSRQTVLATTLEWLELPSYIAGEVTGKSKLARRGLGIQLAPLIDPGWQGNLTLELHNNLEIPIELVPGIPIGAFSFELVTSPALFPYSSRRESRYKRQGGPRP
jgi:dCTP deaminase